MVRALLRRWLRRLSARHRIVAATFLATFVMYVERVGFSIAFTAMARDAGLDESTKGTVLSAFYWGYALSQIPGGMAAQRYGGRIMLIISFTLWSGFSMLTPRDARHTAGIIIARVVIGAAQGFLIPSVHTVLSQWIPPHERAKAVSLTTSGMYLGSAAAMTVLPSLAASLGPGALLTAVGVLGIAWLALWLAVGRDIPHRESVMPMTKADLANPRDSSYDGSFGRISSGSGGGSFRKGRPAPTPWARMLRSAPLWAIVANNFAFHYAFYVIMNWLPTYFDALLGAPLAGLGAAKTLPYLAMFLTSNAGGWLGDSFIHSRRWTVARARKAVNSLGFASAVLALMIMPSATGAVTGIVATTLALATLGVARGGFSVNHMDIAPQYAGVVMGVSNTAGTLAGVVGVAVTGVLIQRGGGAGEVGGWYAAHALSAGVCVAAAAVFAVFARGERVFD